MAREREKVPDQLDRVEHWCCDGSVGLVCHRPRRWLRLRLEELYEPWGRLGRSVGTVSMALSAVLALEHHCIDKVRVLE